MEKKNRIIDFTFVLSCLICLVPAIVGLILWDKLPEVMVRHLSADMEPNGWSGKTFVVIGMPLIALALNIFVNLLINITRRKEQSEYTKFDKVIKYFVATIFVLVGVYILIYNLGIEFFMGEKSFVIPAIGCGIFFLFLGNYIPKAKDLTGINLPGISDKLKEDKDLWFRVRRVWGRIIMICSVLIITTAFLPNPINLISFIVFVFVFAFSPYLLTIKLNK